MFDFAAYSLSFNLTFFLIAAAIIAFVGTQLTRFADLLAERTGLGEALFGVLLLGGANSLAGVVGSATAAATGAPTLAVSAALGGIAAQTVFLALADISYRRGNLEHAAASATTLTQAALLVTLISIVLLALAGPDVTVLGVHPASLVLVGSYLFGIKLIRSAKHRPTWHPRGQPPDTHTPPTPQTTHSASPVCGSGFWALR